MRFSLGNWIRRLAERFARAAINQPQVQRLEERRLLSASAINSVAPTRAANIPRPDHLVIVVEENKSYGQILGPAIPPPSTWPFTLPNPLTEDTYLRGLAAHSASFTNAHGLTHPSQPNYLALFSGSTQGTKSDAVPQQQFTAPSLGGQLLANGFTFAGYSESQPAPGFMGATHGDYARKHNPWSDFADVPPSANLPFKAFPKDFTQLPDVSFVVSNQRNDMHSGSVRAADRWLRKHIKRYAKWSKKHNSLLIVTWDEGSGDNHIPTLFAGERIAPGNYSEPTDHYRTLRTIEEMYALPPIGKSVGVQPITDVFG